MTSKQRRNRVPAVGAGVVFFKVLEWMLSDEAVCEPYLRDLCVAADLVDIRTAARLVMERALFGKERFDEILTKEPQGILQTQPH
ncbi:MAG: hypothetical protein KatS3mg104_3240 [Phycisphaerae bacterium]|nr:MAG: hypothetical protein KatS3mg104_3240 [Phycisphaerae bacterium]